MQCFALLACEQQRAGHPLVGKDLIFHSDCWQGQDLPGLALQYLPDEVLLMQALHDDDHHSVMFTVQPAQEGIEEPLIGRLPPCLRECVVWFKDIVQDNAVGAASGQNTSDRGSHTEALPGGGEIVHRGSFW